MDIGPDLHLAHASQGNRGNVGGNVLHLDQRQVAYRIELAHATENGVRPGDLLAVLLGLEDDGDLPGVAHDMGAGQQHAGPAAPGDRLRGDQRSRSLCVVRHDQGDRGGKPAKELDLAGAAQAKRRFGLVDDLESRRQVGAAWERRGDATEGVFLAAWQGLRGIAGLGQRAECRAVLCGKGSSLQARQQCDQ